MFRVLLLLVLLTPGCLWAAVEQLHYRASYHGLLSGGKTLTIADVILTTLEKRPAGFDMPVMETQLEVSSALNSYVEKRYPFRLRFRSSYRLAPRELFAMEAYRNTTRLKHELTWVDHDTGKVLRFRPRGKRAGQYAVPPLLSSWLENESEIGFHKPARHAAQAGLLDRLAMLQAVRGMELVTGAELNLPVTDGKRLYRYRIRVEGRQLQSLAGRQLMAWKLRFQAVEEGDDEPVHRPVDVWLADDPVRTPLLFENHHPLGRFVVQLVDLSVVE